MNIRARELLVGETYHRNDWHMRIDAVDVQDGSVAIHVVEGFFLHFAADEVVDIDEPVDAVPGVVASPPEPAILGGA